MIKIELSPQQSGVCWTSGGLRMLILPAGYLGSMLFGGLILVIASRTKLDKAVSIIIGGIVVFIALFFVSNIFGKAFSILFGLILIIIGTFTPVIVNDLILKIIGLSSILYAIFDIKDDLIFRTVPGSDAYAMSEIIPLPPVLWGIIWIILAIFASIFFLKIASSKKSAT